MQEAATTHVVAGLVGLLLLAAGTLALTQRLRFPFSIALLILGIALSLLAPLAPGLLGPLSELRISADIILYVFLPTLIFESASHLDWRELRGNLAPVLMLAVPGLMISSLLIGALMHLLTGMAFLPAWLLGAILSATDPVAVIALFKRLGAPHRLTVLVEGESLFNDATAIVLSKILVATLAAGVLSGNAALDGIGSFFIVFFGGIAVGWALGEVAAWLLGQVDNDPAIEITLTTVLAYLSFLIAEDGLHVSGVMATVTAGLSYGNRGWMRVSQPVRGYLEHFWEYMAFVATALIFLMVGLSIDLSALLTLWLPLLCLILAMLVARAVVVFGLMGLSNRLPGAQPVAVAYQSVMYWGGLRGAIALAIALSLPGELAFKDEFVTLVVGAVLFTLLVQGVSVDALVRRLGLNRPPLLDRYSELETERHAARHALARLPALAAGGLFSGVVTHRLEYNYRMAAQQAEKSLSTLRIEEMSSNDAARLLQLQLLSEQRQQLRQLFDRGHLDERVFRHLLGANAHCQEQVRGGADLTVLTTANARADSLARLRARLAALPPWREALALRRVAGDYQRAWAEHTVAHALLARWPELVGDDPEAAPLRDWVAQNARQNQLDLDQMAEQFPEFVGAMQQRHAQRLALLAEIEAIEDWANNGRLQPASAESLLQRRRSRIVRLRGLAAEHLRLEPGELLAKVPLFAELDPLAIESLARSMRSQTIGARETLIRQHDHDDSLFIIARGVVRVSVENAGAHQNLATLMAGDFFGEMALLYQAPRTATVQSVTPCTIYTLKREDYLAIAQQYPDIAAAVEHAGRQRRDALQK